MSVNLLKNVFKSLIVCCLSLFISQSLKAQTYPYHVDFDSTSKNSYADTSDKLIHGITWKMPGAVMGSTANDKKNGTKSARIRLSDNDSGNVGSLYMVSNLTGGAGVLTFNAAMYGSETGDSIAVYYSTNNGINWVYAGNTPALTSSLVNYTFILNVSGNVRIKLSKINPSTIRVNVDDLDITFYGNQPTLNILSKSPTGNNVSPLLDSFLISYDHAIINGISGAHLYLYKNGITPAVDSFLALNATIDSNVAVFHNVSLENNASYYVVADSGLFFSADNSMTSLAINEISAWMFSTLDTILYPPVTTLQESTFSCDGNNTIGAFHRFNELGSSQWNCSPDGNGDASAVSVNGGSDSNVDWLITNAPLDLSSFTTTDLSFFENRRYNGDVTRQLLISTDYNGGNPNNATWTEIVVPNFANLPDSNSFSQISNVSLTPFKNTPFYLAFKYSCGNTGGYEWSIDDIIATSSNISSVNNIYKGNIGMCVLGSAITSKIDLAFTFNKKAMAALVVYDLNGRIIFKQSVQLNTGITNYTISNIGIPAGMYIIRLDAGNNYGVVKAAVK